MKFGILAASTLLGVATFASASLADDLRATQEVGRAPQENLGGASAARYVVPTESPLLQSDRMPAGMLPPQQSTPGRDYVATPSNAPVHGGDLQQALR